MPNNEEIEKQLRLLRDKYAANLNERISCLITNLYTLDEQTNPITALQQVFRQVHTLSGSAGTFGFKRLSELSFQIELMLKECLNKHALPDIKTTRNLNRWLKNLQALALKGPDIDESKDTLPVPSTHHKGSSRLIFIVEDDSELAQIFCLQLEHYGFKTRYFATVSHAILALEKSRPDALVLDIILPEGTLSGADLDLKPHRLFDRGIPFIFISAHDSWESRLAAVQVGGFAYLCKPLDITTLVDHLIRITQIIEDEPYRIIVVDDAYELAQHYSLVLRQAGMYTEILIEPSDILNKLEYFKPDLILLDIYLDGITGMDVAQVIRQHQSHFNIPIVYLSTETESEIQLRALEQGDDFLEKPIFDNKLISLVKSKINRSRELNRLMFHDGLTGLLNQVTLAHRVEAEFANSQRHDYPLCYVMIDLDYFKKVNDVYGHTAGNQVLKSLAILLKDRLRLSDQIGRFGGEEFGIILPNTDANMAYKIIEDIRHRFSRLMYQSDGGEFSCNFSAGIACASAFNQAQSMVEGADKALYQAKENGRNQVQVNKKCHQ